MLLSLLASVHANEVQSIRYDILWNGKIVGYRDLTITYVPEADGEVRLLESRTDATIAGLALRQHATSLGSRRLEGFASSLEDQDGSWEVQAVRSPTGLDVRTTNAAGVHEESLANVELTTLSLMDPGVRLTPGHTRVLSAETGDSTVGTLEQLDEGTWSLVTEGGTHQLRYGPDGHLLEWTTTWLGHEVVLRGDAPPPRTWGGMSELPDRTVGEEAL